MNRTTKAGLNITQKLKLDQTAVSLLNKRYINQFMLKHCWQRKGYKHFYKKYLIWHKIFEKNQINLAGKKILEVGSGASLGLGYFFFNQNYGSWLASDFYQDLLGNKKAIKREIKLIKEVAAEYDKNILSQVEIKGNNIIFGEKLNYLRLNLVDLKPELDKSFDIILSSEVLEHLFEESVELAIKNLAFYLRPGALMIHEIDFRDHINVANPHGFLKYDKASWDKLTRGTIFYTNRLRLRDYLEIFSKNNLKIKFLQTSKSPISDRIKKDKYFKKYDKNELEIIRSFLILQKLS